MEYAIYLHQNNKLITKPKICYQSDPEYFDSPFVKRVWFIKPNVFKISDYIEMLQEAKRLGATSETIKEYLDTWAINEESFNQF